MHGWRSWRLRLWPAPRGQRTIPWPTTYTNTVVATDANGAKTMIYYSADGTYTGVAADGVKIGGTWKLEADKICYNRTDAAGARRAILRQRWRSLASYRRHLEARLDRRTQDDHDDREGSLSILPLPFGRGLG